MQAGAEVHLFNAASGEWRARLIDKQKGIFLCTECLRPSASFFGPHLFFPILKGSRLELLIEKSVELGVGALHPIFTDHTDILFFNKERWQVVVKQATEQCGRLDLPPIHRPEKLSHILDKWLLKDSLLVGDERQGAPSIIPFLDKIPPSAAFLVGPEGGFSAQEFATFARLPFINCVSMGATTLRTETAALAFLALHAAFQNT
jgi:16S rRNA (uracil1498-N3)-methyltransferase